MLINAAAFPRVLAVAGFYAALFFNTEVFAVTANAVAVGTVLCNSTFRRRGTRITVVAAFTL